MEQLKETIKKPASLASIIAAVAVVLQWIVTNWGAVNGLLLSLGLSPEVAHFIETGATVLLTILGMFGVYGVAKK